MSSFPMPEYVISSVGVKQTRNRLLPTSHSPAFLNLVAARKRGELIELSVDRFALLTRQPKSTASMSLYHYTSIEADPKKRGLYYTPPSIQQHRQHPVRFTWASEHMPLLRVRKLDATTHPAYHGALSWKEDLYIRHANPTTLSFKEKTAGAAKSPPPNRNLRFK